MKKITQLMDIYIYTHYMYKHKAQHTVDSNHVITIQYVSVGITAATQHLQAQYRLLGSLYHHSSVLVLVHYLTSTFLSQLGMQHLACP